MKWVLLPVFLMLIAFSVHAQTNYVAVNNGNWDNPSTWMPPGIPGELDVVTIDSGYIVKTNGYREVAGYNQIFGTLIVNGENGSLYVHDVGSWVNGQIYDSTSTHNGTFVVPIGGLFTINEGTAQNKWLMGGITLLNEGHIRIEDQMAVFDASIIDNRGLFEIISDLWIGTSITQNGQFINRGTVLKSGGNANSQFSYGIYFTNMNGTINVQHGALNFLCDGTYTDGIYNAEFDAKLVFYSNGTHIFEGILKGSPAGRVEYLGGQLILGSQIVVLDFTGTGFTWSASTISGGNTLSIPDTCLLVLVPGISNKRLIGRTTIHNLGTIKAESGFVVMDSSVVNNYGLVDIVTDAQFTTTIPDYGIFNNYGTVKKSGGNTFSTWGTMWDFKNHNGGTIDAASGEIRFLRLETFISSVITGDASILVPANFSNRGITRPGNSVGTMNYVGNYLPTVNSVLEIELGGLNPGSEHDQLNINGSAVLNGDLKIDLVNGFIPDAGDMFTIITSTFSITDSFPDIIVPDGLFVSVEVNNNNVKVIVDSVGVLSVEEISNGAIAENFELMQNYPNPFNPSTKIQFSIPQSSIVLLEVYNINGEKAATLVSEELNQGIYSYEWNAGSLASGVYFYSLTAGSFREIRKMILMK
ncbi:MAG: T9SS type A sorting domain-containing protein [Ignavibacteriales bacterium]|nr:MAG: T9SS type A sorting domain-containing protein [Ignavibacteriales bacterium]